MKFGQLIEHNNTLSFKKALYEIKSGGLQLSFNRFRYPSTRHKIETNCIKL